MFHLPSAPRVVHAEPRRAGFTLIEIMVVITILGLLLTIVGNGVYQKLRESKVSLTKIKISRLALGSIQDFRRHHNKTPDTLEELLTPTEKNLNEPYCQPAQLRDAWENEFRYTKISGSKFTLVSLGADFLEGGQADDADIVYPDDFNK